MKAQELRIGNYVKVENDYEIITAIDIDKARCLLSNKIAKYGIEQKYEYINPITLTEKWLVKFGFTKNSYMGFNWYEKNKVDVYINEDGSFENYGDAKVDYVHQLQNLYFALTGEEL